MHRDPVVEHLLQGEREPHEPRRDVRHGLHAHVAPGDPHDLSSSRQVSGVAQPMETSSATGLGLPFPAREDRLVHAAGKGAVQV